MLSFREYIRVQSLDEAYALCKKKSNVILGGMLWLKMQNRQVGAAIDLTDLGLDTIVETEDAFQIGAMVSLRQLETHAGLDALSQGAIRQALRYIVGVQFRNTATVGGSVFGRYGFSDVLTVLMALDATVVLHGRGRVPIAEFAAMPYERDLLTHIIVPKASRSTVYVSQRNTKTDFPVLTCAVSECKGEYQCVIGARPMRAVLISDTDGILRDGLTQARATRFAEMVSDAVTVGGNLRGSAQYRKKIANVLVYRALMQLGGMAKWY